VDRVSGGKDQLDLAVGDRAFPKGLGRDAKRSKHPELPARVNVILGRALGRAGIQRMLEIRTPEALGLSGSLWELTFPTLGNGSD
jgi:hypothetical protein